MSLALAGRVRPAVHASRPGATALAAAVFLVLWTGVLLFPLLRAPLTAVPMDVGDPLLNAAILHWNASVIPFTERWWNFPSYFPASGVTAFTEHLLGVWPLASPVIWLTGNPVLAYNVAFALSFPLAGLAMFALVRHLTGSSAGAFAAAIAFAFAPYRANQLSHLQMLSTWGLPLALLGLHQYVQSGRRVGLVWFGLGWLGAALSNGYFMLFFGVYLGCWLLWFGTASSTRGKLPAVALALLVASLPLAPVLLRYVHVHAYYGFTRPIDAIILYSTDLTGILSASPNAPVAGRLVRLLNEEGAVFPGFAALGLAAWAVARGLPGGASRTPGVSGNIALALSALFFIAAAIAWQTDVRIEMWVVRLSLSKSLETARTRVRLSGGGAAGAAPRARSVRLGKRRVLLRGERRVDVDAVPGSSGALQQGDAPFHGAVRLADARAWRHLVARALTLLDDGHDLAGGARGICGRATGGVPPAIGPRHRPRGRRGNARRKAG